MAKYLSLSLLPTLRFATKFHPYLTVRWVAMVKSQWIIVLKKRKWSLGYTVSLFCTCTLYCLSFLNSSPSSDFVGLLTHNHINSARDTLQPSPPEFSTQQIFCLVRKAVWSWVGGERHHVNASWKTGRKREGVSVSLKSEIWLLNHKWVRAVPMMWNGIIGPDATSNSFLSHVMVAYRQVRRIKRGE